MTAFKKRLYQSNEGNGTNMHTSIPVKNEG